MTNELGSATLWVLAVVGFLRTVVPAIFATLRMCLSEFFAFRTWLRQVRR